MIRSRSSGPWTSALVTGASQGIGAAVARELATRGTDLVIVARRAEPLDRLANELQATHGVNVEVLIADLTDTEDLGRVEQRLRDRSAPIDLLVNNAGGGLANAPIASRDPDEVRGELWLNAVAPARLSTAAAAAMVERRRGCILNISSGTALYPTPGAATYSASKAFLNSFGVALHHEVAGAGVTVTTACPGFVATGAAERSGMDPDAVPRWLWMTPEEAARRALAGAASGRVVQHLGLINAATAAIGRHLPPSLVARIAARAQARSADRSEPAAAAGPRCVEPGRPSNRVFDGGGGRI